MSSSDRHSLAALEHGVPFTERHIGPDAGELARMLETIGVGSLDELADRAMPTSIRSDPADWETSGSRDQAPPPAATEPQVLDELRALAASNTVLTPMLGLGYHGTVTPPVIRRNVLEAPAWYTAYTPYQPEISQGRLEALLNFQTVVTDLTGLDIAGASMLDESTAAAEAMLLLRRVDKSSSDVFLVDSDTLPQTIAVLRTRAESLGIRIELVDPTADLPGEDFFGLLLAAPGASGALRDHTAVIDAAHQRGSKVVVACDLLAATVVTPPGEQGADVAVGSTQRFGVPLGFGGPHAGFLAVRQALARQLPGRLVGTSVDADGAPAHRLALQTREQHIRRDKATSNICTAQVLLAVIASMYAVYHGPAGLAGIARRTHRMAAVLAAGLVKGGVEVVHREFFDTVLARVPGGAADVVARCREEGLLVREVDADHVGLSCSEVTTREHLTAAWRAFGIDGLGRETTADLDAATGDAVPAALARSSRYLTNPVFHTHRSETGLLRYLRVLSDKDVALDRSMIPLGSCTMKLNATAEMEPITYPGFAELHPFAPESDAPGMLRVIRDLEAWLVHLTGYHAVSLQPNAGSQGELAGLLAIRAYHHSRGDTHRDVCVIPASAHGTNAASAISAGMRVKVVSTTDRGDVDLEDLRRVIGDVGDALSAIMITYPSTHGVYEPGVRKVLAAVHDAGGQVYVDGANLNALVGLARPGRFGADVSHLNLHKTFCIPHGGGGPGVGPIGVAEHLAPFLPNHPAQPSAGPSTGVGPVAGAPWGSASILPISWAYIRLMGVDGLRRATLTAVAAANYVAARLRPSYPVLYAGASGLVAHECILDLRPLTKSSGITVDDVAKRLADYGFHAPTMSFPVAGTLMVEPTESEDLAEIDRFCDAMIAIRAEAAKVEAGEWPADDNPLVHAPFTARSVTVAEWDHAYTREEAAFPAAGRPDKIWVPVRRIDSAHGDRHLVCSCPPLEELAS
ncbi:aminomethyl-transferring glycine dehydrogenase [Actinomycetospora sp. TBRC 11914]|uniref:aminomethyl-transferring glycine dehydrogenase n=1 Tax=Actinomycetospora sp. TBRC 11914 TaxID=2729387 RepID=UPI00145EBBCB|nr:aminomethyl-transferring glycine dehydrogenase [Actinomycetospora sp. TBRC 11914]NMO89416.1 aminomethyl-transferring glycine dehydrogenase [Actinomycetospora sp. TBRC 11914]